MIESKKCKGQGKAKSVKGCGKMVKVEYRKYGLCQTCYANFILNTDYGRLLLERATLKAQKPRKDLEKAQKERDERNSLSSAKASTKKAVHDYVKERDKGLPCISCGQPWNPDHQAGHYHKAELYEYLRYHYHNINNQCVGCNIHRDGNLEEYNIGLPKRIGKEAFDKLQELAEMEKRLPPKNWTRHELQEIRNEVKLLMKGLKN